MMYLPRHASRHIELGSSSKLEFKPLPAGDPLQRQPHISFARSALEWTPTISLDVGLAKTIAYFDELLTRST